MDAKTLSIRASEVSESLKSLIRELAEALAQSQQSQDEKVTEAVRAATVRLDTSQSQRDSAVLEDVSSRLKALRDDVGRLSKDRDEAQEKAFQGALDNATTTLREEAAKLHGDIQEEIATANRSTYDTLMAEIKGLRRK